MGKYSNTLKKFMNIKSNKSLLNNNKFDELFAAYGKYIFEKGTITDYVSDLVKLLLKAGFNFLDKVKYLTSDLLENIDLRNYYGEPINLYLDSNITKFIDFKALSEAHVDRVMIEKWNALCDLPQFKNEDYIEDKKVDRARRQVDIVLVKNEDNNCRLKTRLYT